MKLTDLTPQQLSTMLNNLQLLVDGSFTDTDEIIAQSGVNQNHADRILDSIDLLKSLILK